MSSSLLFDEHDIASEESYDQILLVQPYGTLFRLKEVKQIKELRSILSQLLKSTREQLSMEQRVDLGERLLASDRELVKQCRMHGEEPNIRSIVSTAALLYSHIVLRIMKRSSRIAGTLIVQLKKLIISALNFHVTIFDEEPAALTWVLLIGVMASGKEHPEGKWYFTCLERACIYENQIVWEDIRRLVDTPNQPSPQPFQWLLDEKWLTLSSVNTSILP